MLFFSSAAQTTNDDEETVIHSPVIGLGVGMFKFYGDVLDAKYGNPLVSNIGYDLHVKQQINNYFTAKFYVLFGRLSANERSLERNLNFKSQVTTGGFALMYDFHHFLPSKRIISPMVSLGIESVEFHSKTDLYDASGVRYNYWSDGSIRSLPEDDANASAATMLQRDYVYETDLRESNFDGLGKYPERTVAIPFGVNIEMNLTNEIDFTIGTTYHYAFSDLIDDVTSESSGDRIGSRQGNKKNDAFLMTSFSISYSFIRQGGPRERKVKEVDDGTDYLALENADEDADGVKDFVDKCPGTPQGEEVDLDGCPLDMDNDFVPNYADDELETRENAPVDRRGVELSDSAISLGYQRYLDLTGKYADLDSKYITNQRKRKRYKVQVGEYTEAISPELVDRFLSIPDVEIQNFGDSLTIISVGDYDNLPDALKRKIQLTREGFDEVLVVEENKDGSYESVGDEINNMDVEGLDNAQLMVPGKVFRIQLGAFSKKQPKGSYSGLNDMLQVKAKDGLYKYLYKGSFNTFEAAARKKIDLAIEYGFNDAFIVVYDSGKRISLSQAGVTSSRVETDIPEYKEEEEYTSSSVQYRVQVGIYQDEVPAKILDRLMEVNGIRQKTLDNGLTRYTSRGFGSYVEAERYKNQLISRGGIKGAFVIAVSGENLISISKAKKLLGK